MPDEAPTIVQTASPTFRNSNHSPSTADEPVSLPIALGLISFITNQSQLAMAYATGNIKIHKLIAINNLVFIFNSPLIKISIS